MAKNSSENGKYVNELQYGISLYINCAEVKMNQLNIAKKITPNFGENDHQFSKSKSLLDYDFISRNEACELASDYIGVIVGTKTFNKWCKMAEIDNRYSFRKVNIGRMSLFDAKRIFNFIVDRRFSDRYLKSKM